MLSRDKVRQCAYKHKHTHIIKRRPARGREPEKGTEKTKAAIVVVMVLHDAHARTWNNNSSSHGDKQPVLPLQEHRERTGPADSRSERAILELMGTA